MEHDNTLMVEVHKRLCALYGCPVRYFHALDPLSELVSSLLSHRTRNQDSAKAFKQLRSLFPSWEAVRDAPLASIQSAITATTWPEQKAPRLQTILHTITQQRGTLNLDFLSSLGVEEARAWLEKLPGVGPKTSAAVLSFSALRMRALPVDSHHYRVAQRLQLIPLSANEAKAHVLLSNLLPPEWDAQSVYDNHEMLMFHGQRCCFWRDPQCASCVLLDLCPTGKLRLAH